MLIVSNEEEFEDTWCKIATESRWSVGCGL